MDDNNNDGMLHDQIHQQLDRYFNSLETEWTSPMTFAMHTGDDCICNQTTSCFDICAFIGWGPQAEHVKGNFAYFCRTAYPPCTNPSNIFDENGSFLKLKADISKTAMCGGFSIVSNGTSHKKALATRKAFPKGSEPPYMQRTFTCDRYRRYTNKRKRVSVGDPNMEHCKVSLHNDKKGNSRGVDGKKGPRKNVTTRALQNEDTCSFCFDIFVDMYGFYVKRSSGSVTHCNHMKRLPADIPIKLRHLTSEQRRRTAELGQALTRPANGRNFFHANHDLTLTPQQLRYAFHNFASDSKYHYNGIEVGAGAIVEWLRSTPDISYCIWGAKPPNVVNAQVQRQAGLIFSENQVDCGVRDISDLTNFCQEVLQEYTADMENLGLQENQHFFIACAWITNKEKRMFRLFPHVLKIDVTEGTNKESRPLLTVSIRSTFGKYIIILRMFLRDQRQGTFRWVFSFALPKLLGDQWTSQIQSVITDGDSHEIVELEEACRRYMPNCFRVRCGWHIIHKGWLRHCSFGNAIDSTYIRQYKLFCYTVKQWCYTFMYPRYCENENELVISKCLLLAYIHSRQV